MKLISVKDKRFQAAYHKLLHRYHAGKTGVERPVQKILDDVRQEGDRAVIHYTRKFDRIALTPQTLRVSKEEIQGAYEKADPATVASLRYAKDRIMAFHKKQRRRGWAITQNGVYLAQLVHPLDTVGLYVPGGTAAYPSSVLMNAIPAQIAGCPRIVICTPTPAGQGRRERRRSVLLRACPTPARQGRRGEGAGGANPYLLIAADMAGIDEIYRVGGAQAIGAMAFGTETIPKVDKIVGPGNQYVATAKRLVYGYVDIDMVAGPSELLVIADDTANPRFVASDLLSQAEHDEEAVVILLTPAPALWEKVEQEITRQRAILPRKKIIARSLSRHGAAFLTSNMDQAIEMANAIAPEHLALFVKNPLPYADRIVHAAAVFLGEDTPQALGDYIAGPNHVLPTGGAARFFSPLSVDDFIRTSHRVSYSQEALLKGGDHLIRIAMAEGLQAHANMVTVRKEYYGQHPKQAPGAD